MESVMNLAAIYRAGFYKKAKDDVREQWVSGHRRIDVLSRICSLSSTGPKKSPSTIPSCRFLTIHPVTKKPMFCQNSIPNRPRHSLCKCHLRLQDISHSFYKNLEAKVGKTLEDTERAWGLRLMHGICFFGSVDPGHRGYMSQIAESDLTRLIFPNKYADLCRLFPIPTCSVGKQIQKSCVYHIYALRLNTSFILQKLTSSIFDSISGGNLWASERGFVYQAWYARFPRVIPFQNDFFMIRLRQNCPFIFQTVAKFSIFLQPTTSHVSDFWTYSFYRELKKSLNKMSPLTPVIPNSPSPSPSQHIVPETEDWDGEILESERRQSAI